MVIALNPGVLGEIIVSLYYTFITELLHAAAPRTRVRPAVN
jgi:hypothetical protein